MYITVIKHQQYGADYPKLRGKVSRFTWWEHKAEM
jgi:hypothetical protein